MSRLLYAISLLHQENETSPGSLEYLISPHSPAISVSRKRNIYRVPTKCNISCNIYIKKMKQASLTHLEMPYQFEEQKEVEFVVVSTSYAALWQSKFSIEAIVKTQTYNEGSTNDST